MRKKLITLILLFSVLIINFTGNTVSATETDATLITSESDNEEASDYESPLLDINSPTIHASEIKSRIIQDILSGPDTAYWNGSNTFLSASDIYGQNVTAYCMQPKKASPTPDVNLVEGYSVLSPDGLQAAACAISAFGYGGEDSDPNIEIFGGSRNNLAGGSYASYVIDGQLKRGLMINGVIYELTPEEAQAVTGAAIHFFSALAGQGDNVDAPTGSKINIYHNDYIKNSFNELTFLGLHFMNQYKTMAGVALSVENGAEWEKALDDHYAAFSWQIKTNDGNFIDFNPQTENIISDEKYLINAGGTNYVTFRLSFSAAKCSLKLIDHDFVSSMSGSAVALSNEHKIYVNPSVQRCYDYFYVSANQPCTVEYGPLYNGIYSQAGPGSSLSLPTFNQDVIITVPEESIRNGLSLSADTLTGFSATPIYGDGDHDGEYNYSCRLFSDANPEKDYQDILIFSPGNTFTNHTDANISLSVKNYGYLELFKTSSVDKITNNNSNYSLNNATYGLYVSKSDASSDINRITVLTTNSDGYAKSQKLESGIYYLKEISAPKGYELDKSIYTAEIKNSGSTTVISENQIHLNDVPETKPVEFIKLGEIKEDTYIPLEKAGFMACPVSELEKADDGTYIWDPDKAVSLTESGDKEIFTDEKGYAKTISLAYGTYIFKETTVPINFLPLNDITVNISSSGSDTIKLGTLYDKGFNIYLHLNKKCGYSKENIINNSAEFSIWSYDDNSYIDFNGTTVLSTDADGELISPSPLYPGKYRIDEIKAPTGYMTNTKSGIDFVVDERDIYELLPDDKSCGLLNLDIENNPVMGKINICKQGEVSILSSDKSSFGQSFEPLPNVVFGIYAYENIYSNDGHNTLIYKKDEKAAEIETDTEGLASTQKLPYGKYIIKEIKTPENYIPSEDKIITIDSENKDEKIINYLSKARLSLIKKSESENIALPGASYALYEYNTEYSTADEYRKTAYIEEQTTDSNGTINFNTLLPPGIYVVIETKAPEGYYISDNIEFVETSTSKENEKVLSERSFENVSVVSSAYYISNDSPNDSKDHFDISNHYTLSVTDKKIPKTPDTPKTGDKIYKVLSIMFLSGFMLTVMIVKAVRKEKYANKEN